MKKFLKKNNLKKDINVLKFFKKRLYKKKNIKKKNMINVKLLAL